LVAGASFTPSNFYGLTPNPVHSKDAGKKLEIFFSMEMKGVQAHVKCQPSMTLILSRSLYCL
jgi:hypothetical protein